MESIPGQSSPVSFRNRLQALSMGVKLIVVCGMALVMAIPAFFVDSLVDDRSKRAEGVASEISEHIGGPQTFLGPTLVVPYSIPAENPVSTPERGDYLIFPVQASANVRTRTEERHRSLFRVPVFQADVKLDADFDLSSVPASIPSGANLDWSHAEIVVGVSDTRGALADATLTTPLGTAALMPAEQVDNFVLGQENHHLKLSLFGMGAEGLVNGGQKFHVSSLLKFSGAQKIAVLAYGKTTRVVAEGDWRNPGFDGGVMPFRRSVSDHGFTAEWSVPFIARNVRAQGIGSSVSGLDTTAMGVSFVEVADPYQSVSRSLKYILLFLGLVFLTYFVFEATTGMRVHPAQYILVGMAQIIFYLLLLSFAERIGFAWGFILAGAATVGLLSANAGWIFKSRLQAVRAFVIFSLLYTLIYLLLTLEDNALMVGAAASFLAVAAAMYLTRGIDWYGLPASKNPDAAGGRI
ncbi:cell envelope integrity protein CreD [Silvibacterium acidisoli]|uniref:cell envelope integrity protein CreD n=1 Tax=Acidobacteriaceae bacterium ZG23-2 TaxID=2883246 RepID=UPI00406CD14D